MAQLAVMGDYHGPGEQKTAETLARDLPASWHIFAGRKLSGSTRDDLDLIVVGERAVFVLDEKAWGPEIQLGDQFWRVRGEDRRNPLDRVNHLARALAGQFRSRVQAYRAASHGRHLVVAGIVLSYDNVVLVPDDTYADGDVVRTLSVAANWLRRWDASFGTELQATRQAVIAFLAGLPQRDATPTRIGSYEILQELAPLGFARCFAARDGTRIVILRCYPMHGWGPDRSARDIIERERLAIDRLEERDRTWQVHASFEYEARQWIVVPVVPPSGGTLAASVRANNPARIDGRLPQQVVTSVVTDAFRGLAEVHHAGLVHRGLCPTRVFLGRGLRVKFSDFHLARVSGARTIAPDVSIDGDAGTPYRAPECRAGIGLATPASDRYSLALSLAAWINGTVLTAPDVGALRESLRTTEIVGAALADCLDDDPARRPNSMAVVANVESALAAVGPNATPTRSGQFQVGGVIAARYEIQASLGQGGFARTWRARDRTTEADRVLKQFHDDVDIELARREYTAADQIRHDHCARVYDICTDNPGYLVLEYVPGENLRDYALMSRPEAQNLRVVALDVLDALEYLHNHNLVHRDVTPTNIIVASTGRAKLIDFGVSSPLRSTTVAGTPPFIAPELWASHGATSQSDIYGFAVTMIYTMLGRYPYTGDPALGTDRRDELDPPSSDERAAWGRLGGAMLDLLFQGAAADPVDRPASAQALADELRLINDFTVVEGKRHINPVVDSIRRLYRASKLGNGGNRGLDDQFARDTYVETKLDTELLPAVISGDIRIVLLTGNPGDGKTSFLVRVGDDLKRRHAAVLTEDEAGWRMRLDGHTYVAVFDASESHQGRSSDDLMRDALDATPGEDPARRTALLAINDGRLLQFFVDNSDLYQTESDEVHRQMVGTASTDATIALVDLKRRTLAVSSGGDSLTGRIIDRFTAPDRWQECTGCLSRDVCPMYANAVSLRGPARAAVEELVATSHLRRHRRATFRDVRSATAWLITGDRSCEDVHEARERGMDLLRKDEALVEALAFDRHSADYLVQEWVDLDPAEVPAPDVERAARVDRAIAPDPTTFTQNDRRRAQRRLYFGLWQPAGLRRSTVRAYRYLDEFESALRDTSATARSRFLLGLSRLLGSPGYRGENLALTNQGAGGTWAVLKEIPPDEFTLERIGNPSRYVEWRPDGLRLRHATGPALVLTLDTVELVLRVADGDLIGDSVADSVRQEIETFAAALRHSPANAVRIVDPTGLAHRAEVIGGRITLEQP